MSYLGKLAGGLFGYLLGDLLGAVLGVALGHWFDTSLVRFVPLSEAEIRLIRDRFFKTLFSVMGYLAKVDGRVSEEEIAMARAVMLQMGLDEARREEAIDLFNEGKQADFQLEATLRGFRSQCHGQHNLIMFMLETLVSAAYADGVIHPQEERTLKQIARALGVSPYRLAMIEAMVQAQRAFHQGTGDQRHRFGDQRQRAKPRIDLLQEAYIVLGVKSDASDAEVKKAYRRQMNEHHPDKLVARGMPEEMLKMATEKTQEIKAAYDTIHKARNI